MLTDEWTCANLIKIGEIFKNPMMSSHTSFVQSVNMDLKSDTINEKS